MYTIHRTRGLVLSSVGRGEADRMFVIFTEELGRIEATARSVREERSRLRYALTSCTFGEYSFVRGRSGWRLIGARDERNYLADISTDRFKRAALERVVSLISRLVRGEGKNTGLFRVMVEGVEALVVETRREYIEALEALIVLRVLFVLGYISTEKSGEMLLPLVATSFVDSNVVEKAYATKKVIIRSINQALTASHL